MATPKELFELYTTGKVKGCHYDAEGLKDFLRKSEHPLFGVSASDLAGSGEGKLSTPFRSVLKFDPESYTERQVTGDCTLAGTKVNMGDGSTKNVEDVVLEDFVISGKRLTRKVIDLIKKPYKGRIVRLKTDRSSKLIELTPDHELMVDGGNGWKPASEITLGDCVDMPLFGGFSRVSDIKSYDYEGFVYCIGVEEDHSFIANSYGISNCVSHGTRNAVDVSRAVEIDVKSEPEEWVARGATEGIYGSRGHGGQGMSCAGAAKFVTSSGGLLLRQKYDFADLSNYNNSVKLGIGWGSRGVPSEVAKTAQKNRVGTASMVRTAEEVRDAIANGYGVAVCSGVGYSSKRDSFGISSRQGSWAHCLSFLACDARPETVRKYGGFLLLTFNSWGSWNSGGHPDWGPLPIGSFLITQKDAQSMISQNGTFVFSDVNGFPLRNLPDYGTSSFL